MDFCTKSDAPISRELQLASASALCGRVRAATSARGEIGIIHKFKARAFGLSAVCSRPFNFIPRGLSAPAVSGLRAVVIHVLDRARAGFSNFSSSGPSKFFGSGLLRVGTPARPQLSSLM
jgi:hypothetical protein